MSESKIMTTTSSFQIMREKGAILIDKTALLHRMVSGENNAFFLFEKDKRTIERWIVG